MNPGTRVYIEYIWFWRKQRDYGTVVEWDYPEWLYIRKCNRVKVVLDSGEDHPYDSRDLHLA